MRKKILLLIFSSLSIVSLQAQKVTTDYDTSVDFKKFKTYAWLAPGDSVLNRHRADKPFGDYVMYYANQELKSRGMRMDTVQPDAIFIFFTSVEEFITYSQSPTLSVGVGVGGPGYYAYGAAPVAGGKIKATTQQDGILKYVMHSTETGKVVWSGMVEKEFKMSDDVAALIGEVATRIFKKYPVKKS